MSIPPFTTIKLRRDSSTNWNFSDPVLASGEPGFEIDTNKLKIGDGSSLWSSLSYVAGGVSVDPSSYFNTTLLAGSGVSFVYDSGNNTLSISTSGSIGGGGPTVVQLGSVSGTISTDASLGNIFDLTVVASGTLSNPTNPIDGQTLRWRISHGANSLTINLGNKFQIPSTATSPLPFSATSGTLDLLGATYDQSRDKWDVIAFVPGY